MLGASSRTGSAHERSRGEPRRNWLYERDVPVPPSRFLIHTGGSLGPKEVDDVRQGVPDGLTFDAEGTSGSPALSEPRHR
jgi:hypothetical protein